MSSLQNITLNSVNAIEERLNALRQEVTGIEQVFGNMSELEPLPQKAPQRYQALPAIALGPAPLLKVKPQITEDYTKTLQYIPDIMSKYIPYKQEPQFFEDFQILPPRLVFNENTLSDYIIEQSGFL